MSDSRLTATLILQEILENKVFASEAKAKYAAELEGDSAFVNMLVQTSLRHLIFIKKILKQFIKKKLPAQSALAYYAIILGTTEILYMDTPDYAALNSYVELVKKQLDKYVAGFTNAVLRKVAANKETFLEEDETEFFPPEFRKIINLSYGKKIAHKIEQSFLSEPMLDISYKQLPTDLGGTQLPTETLRLPNQGNITKLVGYDDGTWWVQDFAASLAVKTLGENLQGKEILDLCAAPGGKTAQLLSRGAKVTALDISEPRLARLHENLQRLKLVPDEVVCADAVDYLQNSKKQFDAIVLDAPCSATGTLRRHPELVHIKRLSDVEKQVQIQQEILSVISKGLKKGGILVYCTCSLAKQEGEEQIKSFLKNNPDFALKSLQSFVPQELTEILTPEGYIRTLPQYLSKSGGMDGFFIAQLQKGSD